MNTHDTGEMYDAGIPRTLRPYADRTLLDVVRDTARERPGHPALLFKGARLSYRELEQLSDAFAAALVAMGVHKRDRVALLMPNCPQAIVVQLGAWKAGAIVAPINPLYTEHELQTLLRECGAETAVVLTPFYEKVKAVQPQTSLRRVIATNIKEYLRLVLRLLFRERKEGHRIALRPADCWLSDLVQQHAHASRPAVQVRPDDPALLLFTGGTTGTPKDAGQRLLGWYRAWQMHIWFRSELVGHLT